MPPVDIASGMKQLVQNPRSGAVEVVDLPDPTPGPKQVLVRNAWSLISPGTEQAVSSTAGKNLLGKALDRPDQARLVVGKAMSDGVASTVAAVQARLDDLLTPGYSSTGTVEATGSEVTGLKVGERVACVGANAASHAELVVVPEPLTFALPIGLDERWGAFGALGGIAAHGVRLSEVEAGSVVVVIGLGLVGQLAAQLVSVAGGRVIAVDISSERIALAKELGAGEGAQAEEEQEVIAAVERLSGGHGADSVIITAATKDSAPIELAAAVARDRAIVTAVGDVGLSIPRAPFYEKELQLRVSRSYGPGRYDPQYEEEGHDYPIGYVRWTERRLISYFFEEVAAGRLQLQELVTHELPIDRAGEAYEALGEGSRMAILLRYDGSPRAAGKRRTEVSARPARGRLRLGIIGPGLFARSKLLPELAKLDVDLAGVAGRSPARAFGIARRWGAEFAAVEPDELLDDPTVDALVIATRHDTHADLAARALERGKAVFLEKPLAIDREGLDRLRLLLGTDARLVVDFNRGFAPAVRAAADHFAGRSGPLYVGCRVNAGALDAGHWLQNPGQGGGRLVGEGCHFVDLCSGLVNTPLSEVTATAIDQAGTGQPDDSFVLTLRYDDGSVGSIAYLSAGHRRMAKERVEIIGGGRAATIHDFRRISLYPNARPLRERAPRTQDKGHRAILERAIEFFGKGGSPPIPYARLIETTEATLVAREALNVGKGEPVPVSGT